MPSQGSKTTDNPDSDVQYLFEVDGCKVYRFYDNGTRHVVTCRGSTSQTIHRGKSTELNEIQTQENPHD